MASTSTSSCSKPLLFIDTHTHVDLTLKKLEIPVMYDEKTKQGGFPTLLSDYIQPTLLHFPYRTQNAFDLAKKKSFPDLYSEKYLSVKGKETTSSPPILGLESIVCVCCEQNAIEPTVDYINRHDEVYAAFGLHPHHSKDYNDALEKKLIDIHQRYPHKVRAWGECGLDFYYNNSSRQQQLDAFERQLNVAVNVVHKPLVIHTRNAEEDTLCLLKKIVPKDWIIHCHCFTSSLQFATDLLEHFENLFIGVTGISTFKNAKDVRDVIEKVPLNRLLLETDAPFLAPDPFRRSKSAHSGHIPWIGLNISKTKKVPFDEVMHQIRLNTKAVYGI